MTFESYTFMFIVHGDFDSGPTPGRPHYCHTMDEAIAIAKESAAADRYDFEPVDGDHLFWKATMGDVTLQAKILECGTPTVVDGDLNQKVRIAKFSPTEENLEFPVLESMK